MKKTKKSKSVHLDEQSLMYIRAKHEWDERIGSALSQAHNWKLAAFSAMFIAICAVVGVSYIGAQSKIEPYGIALQGDQVLPISPLNQLPETEVERLRVSEIENFIENIRVVYLDVEAQKSAVRKAYSHLRSGDPAYLQITAKFKKQSPFERAETELVKVKVVATLPLSPNTYQAEWDETVTNSTTGQLLSKQRYKATLNTYNIPPTSKAAIHSNPLGFYIKTFNDVAISH
ncbi:VirB8/TrbF family protein (plasmid) [Photobacterium damselae subsp. damselae]